MFESEKHDSIYNRIRYLISAKSAIAYITSHNYTQVRLDFFNFLLLENAMTFHNVIIIIKSVFSKGKNHYHYNIYLEKPSYELPQK